MHPDAGRISQPGSAGDGRATSAAPWFLVVARGHARLVAELRVLFQEYPRIQVIEDRRHGHALLPRGEGALGPTF